MIWLTTSNSKMFTWWWALYWFWSRYVVLFCSSFMFYFLYNLFLESNFVLWSDGSIQLCQFNFHSWQFDRLFVPKLVYHETLFLQLKILSKLNGTEQIREKKSQVLSSPNFYLNCIQITHFHCFVSLNPFSGQLVCSSEVDWSCTKALLCILGYDKLSGL